MGRLIDADELVEQMKNEWDMHYIYMPRHFEDLVNEQQTAFDLDKVVEQFEMCTCVNGHKDIGDCYWCAGCTECKMEDAFIKAIEIVKGGK